MGGRVRGRGLLPGVRARGGGAVLRRGALSLDEALFGAAVALLRERRHLSQESLGEAALLTQFAVSRIERGRPCDLEVRGRLLAALGAAPESALLNQLESVLEDARARAERAARATIAALPADAWWEAASERAGRAGAAGLVVYAVSTAFAEAPALGEDPGDPP